MPAKKPRSLDYQTLRSLAENGGASSADRKPLKPPAKQNGKVPVAAPENLINSTLTNPVLKKTKDEEEFSFQSVSKTAKDAPLAENSFDKKSPENKTRGAAPEFQKQNKQQKRVEKDRKLLNKDRWLMRNGHNLTYAGIFLFTLVVYFRPYELIPALSGLSSIALVIAVATLLIYLPTQIAGEGTLTIFSTEVKCVLFMAIWAAATIPIAKSPGLAWETFNDSFSKIVLIFIVMVNTLRTRARLKGLMWLSVGVGVMLSFQALELYRQGVFKTEGYRVSVDFGGMFGNPNDMAIHLVVFMPIALVLGIASKNNLAKVVYYTSAALMIAGNMVTQSRGGFLGVLATAAVLVWKLGKKQRVKAVLISAFVGVLTMLLAPGNYGLRVLSIFIPSLDPVGSSNQRKELLQQSIIVTLRNPLGIGIGNFPIVSSHNLQTHNAFTQVSSELGWLCFAAYLILIISPLRKLGAIERQMFAARDFSWIYYFSIGIQASIIGYMVSSFFGPVAYNWYVYYPIAYAVCLRRIYRGSQAEEGIETEKESRLSDYFQFQKA